MSASPTTYTKRIACAIACTVAALPAFTGAAAASPTITRVDGNPNCASIGAGVEEYKLDPVSSRSFNRGSFGGNVVVRSGQVFDFTTTKPVDVVIVKGGSNANVYRFTPEVTSANGLHAPVNPNNGTYYGLSHITFCQDNAPPPPPPCSPGGSQTKPDGSPCNAPPPPPPCSPGGSQTKPDGSPCNPPPPPPPCTPGGSDTKADGTPCNPPPPPPPCTPGGSDTKADGTPCTPPPPPPPCTEGGSDMKADGTPCNPPPCTPGGAGTKADGTPCTPPPPPPPPCTEGGSDMKADGTPCNPAPPVPPVSTRVPSLQAPQVLGVVRELAAANASMRGPRRCVSKAYTQVFRGQGIRRITVRVNGRLVRTLSRAGTVRIDPKRYRGGVMRIQARVEYVAASRRRPQTLRATVLRCALQATSPQFTG